MFTFVHWTKPSEPQWSILATNNQLKVPVLSKNMRCIECITCSSRRNISKSLKFRNSLKVFRNLFQNWHLTKNDQKWLKIKLSAHDWGGAFLWSSSSSRIFGYPPDLFERRLRRPLAAAPGWRRALQAGRKRPASPEKKRVIMRFNFAVLWGKCIFC